MGILISLSALLGALTVSLAVWCFKLKHAAYEDARHHSADLERYSKIIDLEKEEARLLQDIRDAADKAAESERKRFEESGAAMRRHREVESEFLSGSKRNRDSLSAEYEKARVTFEELKKEIGITQEIAEEMSFGISRPHFGFATTQEYKDGIERIRAAQKTLVMSGGAIACPIAWRVNDNLRDGERWVRLQSKLFLRAFNGECEAAISALTWSNAKRMEERIDKSFADLNKLGIVSQISISRKFLDMKIEEFRLALESEQKRYEEREEHRRIREQIREEEAAQREIEKALVESQSDEDKYSVAIAKATDEATRAMGAKLEKLTEQIGKFEAKLDEARKKKERAIARAQLTKSGFVYVISNIGSFGEQVVKIGMTRRLEPMERIQELSGASVPFPFDLHAMLYSDDAPALERELHKLLDPFRLNRVNVRREFFHNVDLGDVEKFVKTKGLSAQFISIAEAREYRQTLTLRDQGKLLMEEQVKIFPEKLFTA